MTNDANTFLACKFWLQRMPNAHDCAEFLQDFNPDLAEWIEKEPLLGAYRLKPHALNSEYDSGMIEWGMTITYEHPDDAFHHRMRW